jgi:hypothetical protein
MKTVMISQPMNGLSEDEILSIRQRAVNYLQSHNYHVLDSYFSDLNTNNIKNVGLYYLSKSLEVMSKCDSVYFCKGWEVARGCKIEHEVAKNYGLEIIYEN